jgi:hypothetical protein
MPQDQICGHKSERVDPFAIVYQDGIPIVKFLYYPEMPREEAIAVLIKAVNLVTQLNEKII